MTTPIRVQLSREKGWKMPPNTVRVARPTCWGNPFVIGSPNIPDAAAAVQAFRILAVEERTAYLNPYHVAAMLRGKNLACWCALDQPCHADVLLELANKP